MRQHTEPLWYLIPSTGCSDFLIIPSVFIPSSLSELCLLGSLGRRGPAGLGSPCCPCLDSSRQHRGWGLCPALQRGSPLLDTTEGQKTKLQAWLKAVFPSSRGKEKIKKGVGNAMQNREDLKKTSHNVTRFLCGRNEH